MDYKKLGLKCGIEIHQQLDTQKKLFCNCYSRLSKENVKMVLKRRLRPVAGELGDIDAAAAFEALKNKEFHYNVYPMETCTVEMDSEPPHPVNQEALEIALQIALMLNCDIPDELHVMRKTVIDGSNTSGFQRTVIVGLNGFLETSSGKVGITNVCLEEDSAQIIMNCSIKPGDKVVEIGSGSGALTIALAKTVAPNGKVVSYDKRKDFIEIAQYNIEKAGLEKHVEFKLRDAKNGIDEKNIDSIIMDISQPWELVDIAWGSLKIGGYFCSYSPLISQVEKTVKKLRDHPFVEVYVLETLQREMIVLEKGVRPSFNMLGHTGYLTFARKALAKV